MIAVVDCKFGLLVFEFLVYVRLCRHLLPRLWGDNDLVRLENIFPPIPDGLLTELTSVARHPDVPPNLHVLIPIWSSARFQVGCFG